MYFLGIDLGSSSIKLSILDAENSQPLAAVSVPEEEMSIYAPQFGWAEQDPETWWKYVKQGIYELKNSHAIDLKKIAGIGIAYQMHGLVLTDENLNPIRSSIIWCDSRAAEIGNEVYQQMGAEACNLQLLGSPGNFTASKLKWVKENQPEVFAKAKYMMLPGDFIAAKFSRIAQISTSGLSEASLWNFPEARLATELIEQLGLSANIVPEIVPNFGKQATIDPQVAAELGMAPGVQINYRAGDQPNNALSLNVLKPGETATTAGTSAVIYGPSDEDKFDDQNRINTFLHVNNLPDQKRNGVMLCINGSGISYRWLRKVISLGREKELNYNQLNAEAARVPAGSEQLRFYPFGNGVERIFNNRKASSGMDNLNYNIHGAGHLIRSTCEGIVFAMHYGFEVMQELGVTGKVVRAANANLFLNPVFREIFRNTTQTTLELYNTSGAEGAARGAAYGYGYYHRLETALEGLQLVKSESPEPELMQRYAEIYQEWKKGLQIGKGE